MQGSYARQGKARQGEGSQGEARQGTYAKQGKVRPLEKQARKNEARQGETI
jgi:hypothetical protein